MRAKMIKEILAYKNNTMDKLVLKQCLGIDVSKSSLSLSLCSLTSDLGKEYVAHPDVSNDIRGFKALWDWLQDLLHQEARSVVLLEATGVYHQAVTHYLHDLGLNVSVMQSGRVKRYAQSLDQRSKTDALDSKMLSMLGCERKLRIWHPPSKELQLLKLLGRERSALLKDKCIETNRQSAIESSIYSNKGALKRHVQRLKLIVSQIALVDREMHDLIASSERLNRKMKYLESIPGISFISAATVIGETLGFDSMNNGKQLASFAGYDVVLRDSGTFKGKSKISKKGNSHIRAMLHMPSMTCVRCNPTLKQFYNRLKPNKAKPLVALVAVQRKLLILMFTLWRTETYYDAEYENKKRQELKALAAQDNNLINQFVS